MLQRHRKSGRSSKGRNETTSINNFIHLFEVNILFSKKNFRARFWTELVLQFQFNVSIFSSNYSISNPYRFKLNANSEATIILHQYWYKHFPFCVFWTCICRDVTIWTWENAYWMSPMNSLTHFETILLPWIVSAKWT